ncbi:hypothetical protein LSUCC0031_11100 [Rhodobacterales bacterium LSUCC0031]|nr:hypothetical protein [Rhodobacterales bacterium LSUCC0031]
MPDLEHPDDPRDGAKLKAVLVLVATIAFVLSPLLSQPFTGFDPAQMPIQVDDPPIQPAGYAFAIWGVIYLWLLASAGFGLIRRDTAPDWDRARWPLFASLAIGAGWIAVALSAPVMATILIWAMLIGAVLALLHGTNQDRAWFALPLGLYAGWLTAASCVALGTVAMGYGLGSQTSLSWIMLLAALGIALPLALRLRVASYPIAVAWALIGIVAANGFGPFGIAAGLGAAALLTLALRQITA